MFSDVAAFCFQSAHDASLLLRGIKTLPIRMARHSSTALKVAQFLENHPKVRNTVTYGNLIWAASSKNVLSNTRKMLISRLSSACAKYHPDLCFPFIHSVVSNDSVRG